MIKSIIFDYDGTIGDSLDQVIFRWNESARIYGNGLKVSKSFIRMNNTASWRKFYRETLGIPANKVEIASTEIFRKLGAKQGAPPLYEGIKQAIKDLVKKYDLYIISSHYSSVIKRDLKFHKILNCFKAVDGYEEVGRVNKPDPKFLLNFLSKWKLNKNEVTYIGDTTDEVECGKSAGVKTIGCTWGYQSPKLIKKSKPDFIATRPSQLPLLITKL